jgi:hypothetical protein
MANFFEKKLFTSITTILLVCTFDAVVNSLPNPSVIERGETENGRKLIEKARKNNQHLNLTKILFDAHYYNYNIAFSLLLASLKNWKALMAAQD